MVIQAQLKNRRQSQSQRRDVRRKLRLNVAGRTAGGGPGEVLIHDLSTSGMLVQADESLAIGEVVEVELPRTGVHHVEVVWASGTFFGCRFLEPVPPAAVSAALLRSAPDRPSQPAASDESPATAASFGARLAALRAEQGWAIETLAERLGVSRQAVWYWETGQRLPRAEHFQRIVDVFDLQEQDLLGQALAPQAAPRHALIDELKREVARQNGVDESRVRVLIEL
jgi:transcriptional regulator with XRE-family HTH domain